MNGSVTYFSVMKPNCDNSTRWYMSTKLRFFFNKFCAHLTTKPYSGAAGPGIFEFVTVSYITKNRKQRSSTTL